MSIYEKMKSDWQTYCLMSSISYIEEMSKPTPHILIKKYKDKEHTYRCFHSVRLKMKAKEFPERLFNITKNWENKKEVKFIGKTFKAIKKEKFDGQYKFELNPLWLNYIIAECGKIPNNYSFKTATERINNLVQYSPLPIDKNKFQFNQLLKDKKLAAGAFIISMDLECRGIQAGRPSLCMSEKFKDFLKFMLNVAKKWKWTNNKELSPVKVEYSKKLGINASPQYEFRINIKGLKEIYSLAGPLCDNFKDKCIKLHVERSNNYINLGANFSKNKTKEKIINELRKKDNLSTTDLLFVTKVGTDVILEHLKRLEKKGKVKKQRFGKRYIWSIIK